MSDQEQDEKLQKLATEIGPKVIFPHGFKIVEFRGEMIVQPLTPDEYRNAVFRSTGRRLSDEDVRRPKCVKARVEGRIQCVSDGCHEAGKKCQTGSDHGEFYCYCPD